VLWSAHLSLLFGELPYLERPQAAADAGFTAVETWWPGVEAEAWAEAVAQLGLTVTALNADGGDIAAGERGFLNVPARREFVLDACRSAVALAARCGAPRVNVLAGREIDGEPREAELAHAAATLADCADIAGEAGIEIVVEPINALDVPDYLVPTAADAVALIQASGRPNVSLLFDAYHHARAGGDPVVDVAALVPLIGHVQYADCPGRGAPGTGEVDLAAFARALADAGYDGAIGLEFDPRGATREALAGVPGLSTIELPA
jgi:hydroxypyruvate isomerase